MPDLLVANVDVYVWRRFDGVVEHLLLRRAAGRLYEGSWRMVAGKIRSGEQAWQSAVRELWEETGLHPAELVVVPSTNQFYEWQTDRLHVIPAFAARVDGNPTLNEEHDHSEWLSADMAEARLGWPEQRRLLRMVDGLVRTDSVPAALRIPV